MKRLYIIGNGFDLYHGLPTSYKCFNCFMCREHPEDHERIGRIFDSKDVNMLWSDFENKLGELDVSGLVFRNLNSWMNTELHEFENEFDDLHNNLSLYFQEWVKQIIVSCASPKPLVLDKTAYYISFNYTNTLECLYQIPQDKICHIHGLLSGDSNLMPIFGHGKSNGEMLKIISKECEVIDNKIVNSRKKT